jgi:regulatory protein
MPDKPSIRAVIEELVPPAEDDRFANAAEARKKAMDYLARREYGRLELIKKLESAGFDPDVSDCAVAQLTAEGLQSDRRFLEAFIQSRINQGKGPARIHADLSRRGVSDSLIHTVLEETQQNWRELARAVRTKKFGAARPRDFKEKARQMRFLRYRGFESGHIQAALSADDE